MELAELRVFLTVAAERSFSRAAAKLHRTQPAVSQAIRRLEDEMGERLFDRSSKDGTLTEAGRITPEIYWDRIDYFLKKIVPVAEEAKVKIACHPQDPAMPAESGWAPLWKIRLSNVPEQ